MNEDDVVTDYDFDFLRNLVIDFIDYVIRVFFTEFFDEVYCDVYGACVLGMLSP